MNIKFPLEKITDGLGNLVGSLGGKYDKRATVQFVAPKLSHQEALNMYRGSAIPKKIVEIPAFDACREWRQWAGKKNEVDALTNSEVRLKVRQKVKKAMTQARLFGGAAILIGTDQDFEMPLDPDSISAGGLKYLTVLSQHYIQAGQLETDATMENFNFPRYYSLTTGGQTSIQVHPSHLAIFEGANVPDEYFHNDYGIRGDSVLLAMEDDLKNLEATAQTIASLILEAKIDIVKIPGMMKDLQNIGKVYEKNLIERWQVASLAKSNSSVFLMDGDEDYQQKQINFSNLPNILDRFMQLVAAAADIPATRLFGTAPAGLNATGESDLRNYYDRISSMQTLEIEPALENLDKCLINSSLGNNSDKLDIHYTWNSLWQVTNKEKADAGKTLSEIINNLHNLDVVSPEALSSSLIDVLSTSDIIPGLAAAVEEFPLETMEETEQ